MSSQSNKFECVEPQKVIKEAFHYALESVDNVLQQVENDYEIAAKLERQLMERIKNKQEDSAKTPRTEKESTNAIDEGKLVDLDLKCSDDVRGYNSYNNFEDMEVDMYHSDERIRGDTEEEEEDMFAIS